LVFPRLERVQFISAQQFEIGVREGTQYVFVLLACVVDVDKSQKDVFIF